MTSQSATSQSVMRLKRYVRQAAHPRPPTLTVNSSESAPEPKPKKMWNPNKCKVQLKLVASRVKILQQKSHAESQTLRREIAQQLERKKYESARIKVEHVIQIDYQAEALEIVELYCDLLLARFGLLQEFDRCEEGLVEAVASLIYAGPRLGVKELSVVRDQLVSRFGREFAVAAMENQNQCVSARLIAKLRAGTPERSLVDDYLRTIAGHFGVPFDADEALGGSSGGDAALVAPKYAEDLATAPPVVPPKADTAAGKGRGPAAPSGSIASVLTLSQPPAYQPSMGKPDEGRPEEAVAPSAPSPRASGQEDLEGAAAPEGGAEDGALSEFAELERRFDALRRQGGV